MSHRSKNTQLGCIQEGDKDALLKIPVMTLSHLISMIAIAKWVVCDHDAMTNPGFRRAVQYMEQLVYEQSHQSGGADEVWKSPQDGSYHHPTFPEQDGDAWEAMQVFNEEMFSMKLVETAAGILAEREEAAGMGEGQGVDHYEHLLQDILEEEGSKGLLRTLIG